MIDILLNTWPWNAIMPITLGGMLGGMLGGLLVWRVRKDRLRFASFRLFQY